MIFCHISNIPEVISYSPFCYNTSIFHIIAIFVKYCYKTVSGFFCIMHCSECLPLGEKELWNRTIQNNFYFTRGATSNIFGIFCTSWRNSLKLVRKARYYHKSYQKDNLESNIRCKNIYHKQNKIIKTSSKYLDCLHIYESMKLGQFSRKGVNGLFFTFSCCFCLITGKYRFHFCLFHFLSLSLRTLF